MPKGEVPAWIQHTVFAVIVTAAILWLYGPMLNSLDHHIPGQGEDAAKNYYTVAYHLQHDASYWWFDGMNHPFGDHVTFTDNQPLVSNALKLLGLPPHSIFLLVFLSLAAGAWALWRMLVSNDVPWLLGIFAAVGISMLSPQLIRLSGHYSLAYVGIIPLFMYLITEKRGKLGVSVTAVLLLATAWIHPYFLPMIALFWMVFEFLQGWRKGRHQWWRILVPLLPVILFPIGLAVVDPVLDRPDAPYGFLAYRATISSLLAPLELPYFQSLAPHFVNSAEGGHFIGSFAVVGGLICLLLAVIKRSWNLRIKAWTPHQVLLLAAAPLALLSIGFPFFIEPLDHLLPFTGPLKQFRGIARFSFVFFFAVNLFVVVELFRAFHKNQVAKWALAMTLVALTGFESWQLSLAVAEKTDAGIHLNFDHPELLEQVEALQPQSLVTIPFFHVGTEQLRFGAPAPFVEECFALSLQSGIPMHSSQMSRTSLHQGLRLTAMHRFQGSASNFHGLISDDQPILLAVAQNHPLKHYEELWVELATPLGGSAHTELYTIAPKELYEMVAIQSKRARWLIDSNMAKPAEVAPYYHSVGTTESLFMGSPIWTAERTDWNELIPGGWQATDTDSLELSFWIKASEPGAANTQLWLWERRGEEELRFELSEVGDYCVQVLNGWMLCAVPLQASAAGNTLDIRVRRDGPSTEIHLSEILLRKPEHHYFRAGLLNIDNRSFELH